MVPSLDVSLKYLDIQHKASSPHHPEGNGKSDNAVKTVKRLFKKSKNSEQFALMEFNNTVSEKYQTSPAERFFGRNGKRS